MFNLLTHWKRCIVHTFAMEHPDKVNYKHPEVSCTIGSPCTQNFLSNYFLETPSEIGTLNPSLLVILLHSVRPCQNTYFGKMQHMVSQYKINYCINDEISSNLPWTCLLWLFITRGTVEVVPLLLYFVVSLAASYVVPIIRRVTRFILLLQYKTFPVHCRLNLHNKWLNNIEK